MEELAGWVAGFITVWLVRNSRLAGSKTVVAKKLLTGCQGVFVLFRAQSVQAKEQRLHGRHTNTAEEMMQARCVAHSRSRSTQERVQDERRVVMRGC